MMCDDKISCEAGKKVDDGIGDQPTNANKICDSKKTFKDRTGSSSSSSAYQSNPSNSSSVCSSPNDVSGSVLSSSSMNENNFLVESVIDGPLVPIASNCYDKFENNSNTNTDSLKQVSEVTENISLCPDQVLKTYQQDGNCSTLQDDKVSKFPKEDPPESGMEEISCTSKSKCDKQNKRKRLREKVLDGNEDDDYGSDENDASTMEENNAECKENVDEEMKGMDGAEATCSKKLSSEKYKKGAHKKLMKEAATSNAQPALNRSADDDGIKDAGSSTLNHSDDSDDHHLRITFDSTQTSSLSSSSPISSSSSTSTPDVRLLSEIHTDDDDDDDDDDYLLNRIRIERAARSNAKKKASDDEAEIKEDELTYGRIFKQVFDRQYGYPAKLINGYDLFCKHVCADVNLVKRMGIYCEYEKHSGCVNSLHFNESGNLVASGSDDLQVVVYDWTKEKEVVKFLSNHSSNIFQTKFLPNSGDSHIVTSARDGQVRLAQLSSTGSCRSHKKLAQHKGPVHKISLFSDSPEELYSCGEDGNVFHIDLRLDKLASSFTVKHKSKKVGLNSVSSNPMNSVELCVVGRDPYVRIYDIRKVDTDNLEDNCLKRFRAESVKSDYMHMTCAVYNHIGTEIVASYSNDDIYLFDTSHSDNASEIKRYTGHRNSATVKGVNFYGPECQYVVSGSDCSNVFIWDKQSTEVVNVMHGDDQGVVNVVEPHKHLPMLATSGLDNKVKLWMAHKKPQSLMANLPAIMKKNAKNRKSDREASLFDDGHLLWFLMQTLRRSHRESDDSSADSPDMMPPPDDDDDDDDDNDFDEGGPYSRDVQCAAS